MNIRQQIIQANSWEERYRLLIQAGKNLAPPSSKTWQQWQQAHGCEAELRYQISVDSNRAFQLQAYSQARIINGLLYLIMLELNGKPLESIADFNLSQYFTDLGIAQRLSQTRLNGLKQIEQAISVVTSQHK